MQVLLFPENIIDQPAIVTPVYATAQISSSPQSPAVLLSAPRGSQVSVPTRTLEQRQVPRNEFGDGAIGMWMHKPVLGLADGRYVHGQVMGYDDSLRMLTIRSASGDTHCPVDNVSEVAPVIAALLW